MAGIYWYMYVRLGAVAVLDISVYFNYKKIKVKMQTGAGGDPRARRRGLHWNPPPRPPVRTHKQRISAVLS